MGLSIEKSVIETKVIKNLSVSSYVYSCIYIVISPVFVEILKDYYKRTKTERSTDWCDSLSLSFSTHDDLWTSYLSFYFDLMK